MQHCSGHVDSSRLPFRLPADKGTRLYRDGNAICQLETTTSMQKTGEISGASDKETDG
jgi:hypothetical protein